MRKHLLRTTFLFLIFNSSFFIAKAQWVSIPDTNFGTWLNTNGYSTCLQGNNGVGWQMDTTCPKIMNDTVVNLYLRSIRDLTGIEYFDGLKFLWCELNYIHFMPVLPAGLTQLHCSFNALDSLPTLPGSLTSFKCRQNQLTSLPALPGSLTHLECGENPLTSLPALPGNLTYLECTFNQLTFLPSLPGSLALLACGYNVLTSLPALPASLAVLNCNQNALTFLPALPGVLTDLICTSNQLTSLPALPGSLTALRCYGNQLVSLPVLPSSLTSLRCNDNQLSSLPALPGNLTLLECSSNQLTSIPELPDSLYIFSCNDNPNLRCLPQLKKVRDFKFYNTSITCLPDYPQSNTISNPLLDTVPLCNLFNTNGCEVYWNISGKTYFDGNSNCVKDVADVAQRNVKMQLRSGGNLIQQIYTGGEGYYSFDVDSFAIYDVSIDTTNTPFYVSCPVNNLLHDTITAIDSFDYNKDFGYKCKPGIDLAAWSISAVRFRPARFTDVDVHLGSASSFYGVNCAGGVTGSVSVVINGPAHYISPAPNALAPTNVSGNVLTYNVPDFGTIDFNNSFGIIVQTDTTAPIGDTICFTVTVTTTNTDAAPANNTITICFVVVGSFDPNDKQVYPIADIDPNGEGWLTYTVNFQNTGTDTAIHIYITDTLDSDLDAASFQLLAYSHQPLVQLKENAVRFNFPNIMLVDSNANEPLSHGYVQYKIKLKDNLAAGTQINNTAFIYFDFNAPVVTNTTTNTIAILTSAASIRTQQSEFRIYPNPATNQLTINLGGLQAEQVSIYNVDGKLVSQTKQPNNNSIDISHLAKGVYVAEVKVKKAVQRVRWVKM